MSMIFSALREIDKPGDPAAVPAPAMAAPARRSLAPWIAAGAVLAGGAGAAAYLWLQQARGTEAHLVQTAPAPAAGTVAVAAEPPATPVAVEAATTLPAESLAPVALAEPAAAPATESAPHADAVPAAEAPPAAPMAAAQPAAPRDEAPSAAAAPAASTAPTAPADTAAARPAPQRAPDAIRVSAAAPADHGAKDARVALQVQAFNAAMAASQFEAAGQALAQLKRDLRPESITLLRMSAWHAMATGQAEQARLLYGEILHRLPGDENAGINAAILAWDAGRHDTAREIIERLRLHHPDSELIKRYRKAMQGS